MSDTKSDNTKSDDTKPDDTKPDNTKPDDPVERPNTNKADEEGDDGVVTSQPPPRMDAAMQQASAADVDASDERADVADMSDRPGEQHSLEMQEATSRISFGAFTPSG